MDDLELCKTLCEYGQKEVLASFTTIERIIYYNSLKCLEIQNFLSDVRSIGVTYPGGVPSYIESAKKLIDASVKNVNAFDGFRAKVSTFVNHITS